MFLLCVLIHFWKTLHVFVVKPRPVRGKLLLLKVASFRQFATLFHSPLRVRHGTDRRRPSMINDATLWRREHKKLRSSLLRQDSLVNSNLESQVATVVFSYRRTADVQALLSDTCSVRKTLWISLSLALRRLQSLTYKLISNLIYHLHEHH